MASKEDINERYEAMLPEFGKKIDEPTREMLRSYCTLCVQVDELNARIEREGYMIEVGGQLKENPCVNTVHKLNADKARYFAPLKRVMRELESDSTDRFADDDDFMGY